MTESTIVTPNSTGMGTVVTGGHGHHGRNEDVLADLIASNNILNNNNTSHLLLLSAAKTSDANVSNLVSQNLAAIKDNFAEVIREGRRNAEIVREEASKTREMFLQYQLKEAQDKILAMSYSFGCTGEVPAVAKRA